MILDLEALVVVLAAIETKETFKSIFFIVCRVNFQTLDFGPDYFFFPSTQRSPFFQRLTWV